MSDAKMSDAKMSFETSYTDTSHVPGFKSILLNIAKQWETKREQVQIL
jgi:uncharacterized protein YyaL (SSP411 family)